jgi:hypothetical protein
MTMAKKAGSNAHTMGSIIHMAETVQQSSLPDAQTIAARRKALELLLEQLNENATDQINSPPYLKRSSKEAVYLAELVPPAVLATCREIIDLPKGREFTGWQPKAVTISTLLAFLLTVATKEGHAQQTTFNYEVQSLFVARTASRSLICCTYLQRGAICKVLHSSSSAKLDWRALLSKGGALHHGSAIPLAALLMYITAVVKTVGESNKQAVQW